MKRGRAQRVDNPADVSDARGDLSTDLVQQGPGRRPHCNAAGGQAGLEAYRSKRWTEPVVQIPTEAEPLVLARRNDCGSGTDQVLMQPDSLDRWSNLLS